MGKIKRAIIFSAGLGTRFKPWTDNHPKALARVNNKPLLQRNIEYLQRFGINEVVINVHHFANQIKDAIKENNGWGSKIFISDESHELLETGGGLLHAYSFLKDDSFVSINVDVLTTLDLNKLIDFHFETQALATLSVQQRTTTRFFLWNKNNRLCGWKNTLTGEERISIQEEHTTPLAFTCVTVYHKGFLDLIKQRGKFSITEPFLQLAPAHLINGYDHTGDLFIDVGKPESVKEAEKLFS